MSELSLSHTHTVLFLLTCPLLAVELWELFICFDCELLFDVCDTHFVLYPLGYSFTILILVNKLLNFDTMLYYHYLVLGPEVTA